MGRGGWGAVAHVAFGVGDGVDVLDETVDVVVGVGAVVYAALDVAIGVYADGGNDDDVVVLGVR